MLDDAESARGVVELGLRRDPGHPDLLEMQGNVLARLGFRRAAEASYQDALEVDPDRRETLLELARVQLDLDRAGAALEPLERRIELGASDPETFVLYGRALTICGRYPEAFSAFDRAFVLGLDEPRCLVAGAALYLDPGLRNDPDANERAVHWLLRAVYRDPQLTTAHYYLGLLHEDAGRDGQALMRYRRAAESDPSHAPSLYRMAVLYAKAGETERAQESARRALEFERDPARRKELEALLEPEADEATPR
jgi:tetratricopeptide (TPR) repeat protein